ncbi:TGF-beta receptor type-2-like isoform X1 [Oncorhynchus keta]|uniref:TGF-beta receptor type-2-like isoform X1 n=1 Tax=Oncorhynchus keta TaxID=8018 RepID=UPI0015FE4244|nr:TGF-beta receptor type-2-like isoform X1 [Oncorhynchus keta]
MGCWRFSAVNIVLLSFCLPILSFTHIKTSLCKWCDYSSPICEDSVCYTNCSLSSFCNLSEEICVAIWRKDNQSTSVKTLCHQPQQPLENIMLSNYSSNECVMTPHPSEDGVLFVCGCLGEHECNDKLIFDKGSNGFSKLKSKDVIPVVVISLVPPFLVAIIASMAFYLYRTKQPSKQPKDWAPKRTHYKALDIPEGLSGDVITSGEDCHGKRSAINGDTTSDMCPVRAYNFNHNMEQLPIQLEALVGKGRFAEVWRAKLHHQAAGSLYETVAVKIFPSVEYVSWSKERAIFSDANLEHDNVVKFLTAEERGPSGSPQRQYWLVMAYHSLGNLQDFLGGHVLSWAELCAMAGSVAQGLAHLHSDTTPCGIPKVPVAHRDLKSSNIVVKSRRECALCDFGLALRLDLSLTVDDFANSGQVGTARYMAPEVLESRVNLEDLEAFKQMDVYSMALVLWEMVSRCEVIGEVKSYEPPFGSKVCDQPCVDSMRDLVLRDRGRPEIPTSWTTHQGMDLLCATINECWDHDPEARLTAHCVVERFGSLEEEMEQKGLDTINSQNNHQGPPSGIFPDCDVDPLTPETDTEGPSSLGH